MKLYIFGGSSDKPDWYFTESRLSKPKIMWDRETKRVRCFFHADDVNHIGHFHILSLKQLCVLPFKNRLYFDKQKAKKKQSANWRRKEGLSDV